VAYTKRKLLVALLLAVVAVIATVGVCIFPESTPVARSVRSSVGITLVPIAPGSFMMGSEKGKDNAKPVHKVTITQPFLIGATEITQGQYRAVMKSGKRWFADDNLPMEHMSWNGAVEFCSILTDLERSRGNLPPEMEYRLPTDAEWEYCCRAGSTTEYFFGDDAKLLGEYAWCKENSGEKAHPVGTRKPNAWGLYDMLGNMMEWCLDSESTGYASHEEVDPRQVWRGYFKVERSGSWNTEAVYCTSASRGSYYPNRMYDIFGFRVVCASTICAQLPESLRATYLALPEKERRLCDSLSSALREEYLTSTPDQRALFPLAKGMISHGLKMVPIKPGSFMMGSQNPDDTQKPVHKVTITRSFFMSETEITRKQYTALMGRYARDLLPAEYMSWDDARLFCRRLTDEEQAGGAIPEDYEYRLPTEAEWEYCARAGSTTDYCFGDDANLLGGYAWFKDNTKDDTPPAGSKKPNAWGLFDMHGSVSEWCLDWYAESYLPGEQTDPCGPAYGSERATRGGSYHDEVEQCRSVSRVGRSPDSKDYALGFRVVCAPTRPGDALANSMSNSAGIPMVAITPGSFLMGSDKGGGDEKPVHTAVITRAFLMSATEVTQKQYEAVMGVNPSRFNGLDLPVEQVSWDDAMEFCRKLTESDEWKYGIPKGLVYRLPTEAEWEYCARAGSTADYSFSAKGSDDAQVLGEYGWFGVNSARTTHPVRTRLPNAWGLFDMYGNVSEWCLDWHSASYDKGLQTDPRGPDSGEKRVARGGHWFADFAHCSSARRSAFLPYYWASNIGFRIVLAPQLVRP